MMQQYLDAKATAGDALLFFRMGDFYELFHEDAKIAAKAVGLTLTSRDKGENPIPMAGFPHHQLQSYLGKLIGQGIRVAICDQVEDPKQAKGLVKREITRVVTPGTLTDDALLDPRASNFLAAVASPTAKANGSSERIGLAWIELSTGEFYAASVPPRRLADELARVDPSECLISEEADELHVAGPSSRMISRRPAWAFASREAETLLCKHFSVASLEGFGFTAEDAPALRAAGALLDYLHETQKSALDHIDRIVPWRAGDRLELDEATRRSLEITRTMHDGSREGSMLAVIDRTVTPMGARLLAAWLASPLIDIAKIDRRLDAVSELVLNTPLTDTLRYRLREIYDLERLLARVTTGRAGPRDLAAIGRTLGRLPKIKAALSCRESDLLTELEQQIDLCPELYQQLDTALVENCPLSTREGGIFSAGYHAKLDELRELAAGGKKWIAQYQSQQIEELGIPSMKVGYNRVFGYYLEISNVHRDKAPDHYIRKQTLKNAERYITPELKEYEEKVVVADEQAVSLEHELFESLRETVHAESVRLKSTASALAQLDTLASLATLASERSYCRPQLVDEPVLDIREGRHVVLDIVEPAGAFVPNDTFCDDSNGMMLLITGPNMAGKSTYIRQVALITLLAQAGSFVPAEKATLGVADRIFARVGASDHLAAGQSTFMVEMTETARILNTATPRSLVILDEIGRGTSTYDGVSLAWAIVEHLHDKIGCRTLFATHYHELTDLAESMERVANLNVAVKEWEENVVFLHKIVPGSADKSYGIHVARLAGVPPEVNERAKQILTQLESQHVTPSERTPHAGGLSSNGDIQLTLFAPIEHPLLDNLREIDVDALTPLEALQYLARWQEELAKSDSPKPR